MATELLPLPCILSLMVRHYAASLATLLVATACGNPKPRASTPTPEATYVGRAVCAECHAGEASRWADSHHDLAMQEPNADTVLGDFAGATFDADGVSTRFQAHDGGFFVETEGRGGETREYEIAYVFGVEPLQQYLVGFPDGRFQVLRQAWDSRPEEDGGQRWIHLYPGERIPPRRCPSLDRAQPELELHVLGVPFDEPEEGLRCGVRQLRNDLVGDRRLLRVVSRSGVGPRRLGARRQAGSRRPRGAAE